MGLNALINVLGHRSINNFHQSYFSIRVLPNVSRYAKKDRLSTDTPYRRTGHKHDCITRSTKNDKSRREIGLKLKCDKAPSALQAISDEIMANSFRVPKHQREPVVQTCIETVQACIVAPDHLLTALFRDALNILFTTVKKKAFRDVLELYLISYLTESGLTEQRKLFHL